MVKIGFVVEGFCEKLLVESANFQAYATQHDLKICHPVINACGGGNLCTKNIEPFVKRCRTEANPDRIVVLTDLECDLCVTATKARIVHEGIDKVIVVKKALEAWFIADTEAMRTWLSGKDFFETAPELTPDMPWQRLKKLLQNVAHEAR